MLSKGLARGEIPALDHRCKPLYCSLRRSFLPFFCPVRDFDDRIEIHACFRCGSFDCPAVVVLFKNGVIDETAGNVSKADRPIIFMISAPLLTAGVPVELPKTEAGAMQDVPDPITISIRADGRLYVGDGEVPFANLSPRLKEMASDRTRPIYVRADGKASYAVVAQVMASLSTSGFTSINLITDTGGPSSGGDADEAAE